MVLNPVSSRTTSTEVLANKKRQEWLDKEVKNDLIELKQQAIESTLSNYPETDRQ
jgi:ribosomal 50S subunit-associated protein YjgA (DUF615 family)